MADHLPWAALVAPGVVLNKDGSFMAALRFRGPDLESSTEDELMAVRARLNNALKRLGSGWCVHVEARRRRADSYPAADIADPVAWLVDEERRAAFDAEGAAFETDYRLALTWLPPADDARRLERFLFENAAPAERSAHDALEGFRREVDTVTDLVADAMPECARLDDAELLTWLHACISPSDHAVVVPATPAFLDAQLADAPLTGGLAPRLGTKALRVVSVRSYPGRTVPGLLDALGALPFTYRWTVRWLALDKADAEREIARIRKQWFAKRKGVSALLREAITKEDAPLLDSDALSKAQGCDGALEALGADVAAYGYLTLTVSILEDSAEQAEAAARQVEAVLNAQGFVARVEDLNAVEAWLGSLPGEPYADVRRPMLSTLNLADLLPVSAVWAGPSCDAHLNGAPLLTARTAGSTPFRFSLHVGDVGHAMVVGPTGSGKSALLAFMALQFLRYPGAQVVFFDKGRSARAMTLATGGTWHALSPGSGFALQPLAELDDEADRAWAAEWISDACATASLAVTPKIREAIWSALGALGSAPAPQRTLTVFCALVQEKAIAAALEPLTLRGPHGALLDADTSALDAAADRAAVATFELEALMSTPSVVAPALGALFRAVERRFDGRPTLLVLDEAWLMLDETRFARRIREWLKTLRKHNVSVVFATQSLDDVAGSAIASTLIESCPTQIFLPNPRALEPQSAELYRGFGLNRRQLELIAFAAPKRSYYLRQPGGRRLVDLKLHGAALAVCGASSPEDQALIDALLAEHGAADFAPAFLKAKGLMGVDALFQALERAFHPQPETPHAARLLAAE